MPDLREIIFSPVSPTDPEAPAKPISAERFPREYDWEPIGYGQTETLAKTDLLDKEWEVYNG